MQEKQPLKLVVTASILGFGFALGGAIFSFGANRASRANPALKGACIGCANPIGGRATSGYCSACGTHN